MKIVVVIAAFFVFIENCDGQVHPLAYGRDQASRGAGRESDDVSSYLSRLLSTFETRLTGVVRNEFSVLNQRLGGLEQSTGRLETAINLIKHELNIVREAVDMLRDDSNLENDQELRSTSNGRSSVSLDGLQLTINSMRGSLSKVERDVMNVKKNLRMLTGARHQNHQHQPQFALLQSVYGGKSNNNAGACSPNDNDSGIRKYQKDFFTYCEVDSEDSSNWIVIQNRVDGSTDFSRSWSEYKNGFGNLAGEFWFGLEKIHELTSVYLHELMIVMESFDGTKKTAKYSSFGISAEPSGYALNMLGTYSGDAGDSLGYHAGMKFSTFDNDNDAWMDGNCARSHLGGWWYNSCDESNLNGKYFGDVVLKSENNYQGIYWSKFLGSMSSLKSVKMMIRPVE